MSVGIPVEYIPDQNMRLHLYRRLANLQNEDEIHALTDELRDRFGEPPDEIRNLLYQMQVKTRAELAGLTSVSVENQQIVLRFPPLPEGVQARELPNIGRHTRTGKNSYWMPLHLDGEDWRERLLEVLSEIMAL